MAFGMHIHILRLATIVLFLIGSRASLGSSRSLQDASMQERHEKWMYVYWRTYKDIEEREKRFNIFKANLARIETFNSASNKSYKLGLNQFADLTDEEYKASLRPYVYKQKRFLGLDKYFDYKNVTVPAAIDWRKKGAVTPIKSGTCGSWAVSAVEAVEGIHEIKTGKLVALSQQQLIDCYTRSCRGGSVDGAFGYIIRNKGITTESNYPSTGAAGTCDTKKEADHAAKIIGYQDVPPNDEAALTTAVAGQPVSAGIDASSFEFQFYANGVFTGDCGTDIDHDVTIVGYGVDKSIKYWLVKNSWGTGWGEKGYIRLERDVKAKEGKCGIAMLASYPTV